MPFAVSAATASLIAAGVGAAGAVAGAAISADGAKGAAKTQADAIKAGQASADAKTAPYVAAGLPAVNAYTGLLGLNGPEAAATAMGNFQKSPGYDWSVSEGLRAVDAGASAKGYLRSGATLRAEQTLGNNLANQDFGNYFNRLNSLVNVGSSAATGQANTATSGAGTLASIYGKESENSNKAIQTGLNSLATAGADAYKSYQTSKPTSYADTTSGWGY